MIISIPTHARDVFISMCQDVKNAETIEQFSYLKKLADVYSRAIEDICGRHVWYNIIMEADLEVGDDDCPTCCGIPIIFKTNK